MSIPATVDSLPLSDDQRAAVLRAAAPLQEPDREPFIQAVYDRLCGQLIGPGSLHRALREAQAEFLRSRPVISAKQPTHQIG